MIRVTLPQHLQVLANAPREVQLDVAGAITQKSILDALEARYPTLRGTIRTLKRRPMVRFFVCEEDISLDSPDAPLPEKVAKGEEPFYIIGAIAGG
jgi:sulfur-carrier protein